MKVAKKQKIYGAVLLAAVVAWGVDRVTSGPEPTEAAVPYHPPRLAAADAGAGRLPEGSGAADTTAAAPAGWLARRLQSIPVDSHGTQPARDVFVAASDWQPPRAPAVVAPASPPPPPRPLGEDFARRHHLVAVVIEGKTSSALIDDELVPIGQSIEGFQLVDVTRHSASFMKDGETVRLTLPAGAGTGQVR